MDKKECRECIQKYGLLHVLRSHQTLVLDICVMLFQSSQTNCHLNLLCDATWQLQKSSFLFVERIGLSCLLRMILWQFLLWFWYEKARKKSCRVFFFTFFQWMVFMAGMQLQNFKIDNSSILSLLTNICVLTFDVV